MRALGCCVGSVVCTPLLLLAVTFVQASEPSTYDEAVAAFERGAYDAAADRFRDLIEANPTWAPGHVVLGQCYYLLGRSEPGEESIRTARELDPQTDLFAAYYAAGQLLYKQEHFDRAIPPLEKAVEHAPVTHEKQTLLQLAYSFLMADRHEQARASFETWQDRYGVDSDSSYFLALACRELSDYPCALQNLRRAVPTGGEEQRGRKRLEYLAKWSHYWALLSENRSRREELIQAAVADTRSWYEAEPRDPTALRYHVETFLAAGRVEDAIDVLVPLATRHQGNCTAQTLLARAFNAVADGRRAEKWASEAVACAPINAEAHVELAAAYIHQLRHEHAKLEEVREDQALARKTVAALRKAIESDSDGTSRAERLVADAQHTLERLDQAEAEFMDQELDYQNQLRDAQLQEIRQRCQNIMWIIGHDPLRLSTEDEAFHGQHDCKQYAR
jgi:tetratricopeptide (TPR) repeat protein